MESFRNLKKLKAVFYYYLNVIIWLIWTRKKQINLTNSISPELSVYSSIYPLTFLFTYLYVNTPDSLLFHTPLTAEYSKG